MLSDKAKDFVARDQSGIKIDHALRHVRIGNGDVQTVTSKVPAKVANRDPVAKIGRVHSRFLKEVRDVERLIAPRAAGDEFRDHEWWKNQKVIRQCIFYCGNTPAIDVID